MIGVVLTVGAGVAKVQLSSGVISALLMGRDVSAGSSVIVIKVGGTWRIAA